MYKHKKDIELDLKNKEIKLLVVLYKTDITTENLEIEKEIIINLNQSKEEDMVKELINITNQLENKLQQNKDLILEQYKNSTKPITIKPSCTLYILIDNKYLTLPATTIKSSTHKKGETGYYLFELTSNGVLFEQYTPNGVHSYTKTEINVTTYKHEKFTNPTNSKYAYTYTSEFLDFKQNIQNKHRISINENNENNEITENLESIAPIKK